MDSRVLNFELVLVFVTANIAFQWSIIMQNEKSVGHIAENGNSVDQVVEKKKLGRPRGIPNRTTRESREAIAKFVGNNLQHLDDWLMQVAHGLPKVDADGEIIRDNQGSVIYVVRPSPLAALNTLASIAEFHVPRLKTIEATVATRVENNTTELDVRSLSTDELKRMLLRSAKNGAIDVFDFDDDGSTACVEGVLVAANRNPDQSP